MIRQSIKKRKISIDEIGRKRFWTGLSAGLLAATVLCYFFNYSREALRFVTGLQSDLLILSPTETYFYNYFYASLSTTLGLGICLWIWMSNRSQLRNRDGLYKRLIQINLLLTFWVTLMMVTRLGSILSIIPYGLAGFDSNLNLNEEFPLLFILCPLAIFLQNWLIIRQVYLATKWIVYSGVLCIFTSCILANIAAVEDDIISTSYYKQFETEYRYLDTVIENAKNRDNVDIDEKTIKVLKKWYTESSRRQARDLQMAFRRNQKVTIDTIILERILQHNLKSRNWHFNPRDSTGNWHYARPIDIYNQIRKFKVGDPELMHLFLLLKGQIELWNTPELNWDQNNEYSRYERRRGWFAEYQFPNYIFVQLKTVRDTLVKDSIYSRYQSLLPTVNLKK